MTRNLTMRARAAGPRHPAYDASVGGPPKIGALRSECGHDAPDRNEKRKRPARSQRYDPSAVIRPQNTMGTRAKPRKPCDATSAVFTMRKKFVTFDQLRDVPVPVEARHVELPARLVLHPQQPARFPQPAVSAQGSSAHLCFGENCLSAGR